MEKQLRYGLDIGIGSLGWAIISGERDQSKIEDCGVRIYDSGEVNTTSGKDRKSQIRRGFRGTRRLIRRRYQRKEILKNYLERINFLTRSEILAALETNDGIIFPLKVKALTEQISKQEIFMCLIHACNHRGYRDFYESDSDVDDEEEGKNKEAANLFDGLYSQSGCKTISEFICKEFTDERTGHPSFRNIDANKQQRFMLIRRKYIQEETKKILESQMRWYSQLDSKNTDRLLNIIFSQRDFEDGPGDPHNDHRRYSNYLSTISYCQFYKDQKRGYRGTVIGDIYALTNTLSQYGYVNTVTGEYNLPKEAAYALISYALLNASLKKSEIKTVLKEYSLEMRISENSDDGSLSKCIKYLNKAKACVEACGLNWKDWIDEEQFDINKTSKLHQIGIVLSENQTPKRREKELTKLNFMTPELVTAFMSKKTGGTSNASFKYMCDAIDAFLNGEIYGNFQARKIKENDENNLASSIRTKLLSQNIFDEDIKNNPVVYRAVNETRKLINELIRKYGSPTYINVEVAGDLNRSFTERNKIQKEQRAAEKERDAIRKEIAELLKIEANDVKPIMIEKYRLYEQQEHKCLYSGKPLGELKDILNDTHHLYEVDHIVPFSLILDNTLANKALVYANENQEKGQRSPLMYLKDERRSNFTENVNYLAKKKNSDLGKKKYQYLMLENIYDEELLGAWKSRNINDTRYITKYIVSLIKNNLQFAGDEKSEHVLAVKGALTSKFRKQWLNKETWGSEDKNRSTYLNHTADAIVIANMTRPYIEIASDYVKLGQLRRAFNGGESGEYLRYLDGCVEKMKKYYYFSEEYTRSLLKNSKRIPAYLPRIAEEVDLRLSETEDDVFNAETEKFYATNNDFIVKPHRIITSRKLEKKFRGEISDANMIKVAEINGEMHKIKRKPISEITAKDIPQLRTRDTDLITSLNTVFAGQDDKYTVENYLKDNGLDKFKTQKGQPVYKVTLYENNAMSGYYNVESGKGGSVTLGGLKYYCVEVYKDEKGKTHTWGIRFVDMVKRDKKLYIKQAAIPKDYSEHILYMFSGDYIRVHEKDGSEKFSGFYKAVKVITRSQFTFEYNNRAVDKKVETEYFSISMTNNVKKYYVDTLGNKYLVKTDKEFPKI